MGLKDREARYRRRTNWKKRRRRQVRRQLCIILTLVLVFSVLSTAAIYRTISAGDKEDDTAKQAEAKDITLEVPVELVDEPFVNILEETDAELNMNWDEPVEKELYDEIEEDIKAEIDALSAEGYTTGFMLYDLNTGGGISYRPDEVYYSASAIKGPYVAWVVREYPEAAVNMYSTISNTISWSSNSDYFTLINTYGKTGFDSWAAEIGCNDIAITDGSYAPVNARDFTRLWINIYDYFMSEDPNADTIRDLYNGTLQSCIYEALGEKYTVYSKAGWIGEGAGTYYNVQNDAGIVMKDGHPYVLVLLTDAYGRLDMLDRLADCLDRAHSGLCGLGYERISEDVKETDGESDSSESLISE